MRTAIMLYSIIMAVMSYQGFNVAIWISLGAGGIAAMGLANIIGGVFTSVKFRGEIRDGARPNLGIALLGAVGIGLIVLCLSGTHHSEDVPVSFSMEFVYNIFIITYYPVLLFCHRKWPETFNDEPDGFDLCSHLEMFVLISFRVVAASLALFAILAISGWIAGAVLGYVLFNISIKLSNKNRATNVCMNLLGGFGLLFWGFTRPEFHVTELLTVQNLIGAGLGGISIFGIVRYLGESYAKFGGRNMASLVAPLVYDGILVIAPFTIYLASMILPRYFGIQVPQDPVSWWTITIAMGMLLIAASRYIHHDRLATKEKEITEKDKIIAEQAAEIARSTA